jgi:hypothetical protein
MEVVRRNFAAAVVVAAAAAPFQDKSYHEVDTCLEVVLGA